jgi:hypothetical protein
MKTIIYVCAIIFLRVHTAKIILIVRFALAVIKKKPSFSRVYHNQLSKFHSAVASSHSPAVIVVTCFAHFFPDLIRVNHFPSLPLMLEGVLRERQRGKNSYREMHSEINKYKCQEFLFSFTVDTVMFHLCCKKRMKERKLTSATPHILCSRNSRTGI